MTLLTIVLCCLILAGLVYHGAALFCVREFFRQAPASSASAFHPVPVSVLKPVAGVDPGFRENLATFCSQDYPEFEVLLGFSDTDRASAAEVREHVARLNDPHVRIVMSCHELGPNRKVSNLQGLVDAARHPLMVLSDSDMRVPPDYLRTIVSEYAGAGRVGLVTNLYKIADPRTPGAALESLTIALDLIPSVLVARRLEGMTFGLGASLLLSRDGLRDIGGLRPLAHYLADDYQVGNRLWKNGYRIVLSRLVLETVPGPMTVREYLGHQLRWARTYRASRPMGYFGYGITHILPLAMALLLLHGPGRFSLSVLAVALLLRLCEAAVVEARVMHSKRWLLWGLLLPVKDLLAFCLWLWSFFTTSVVWRGRSFRVMKEGRIRENI